MKTVHRIVEERIRRLVKEKLSDKRQLSWYDYLCLFDIRNELYVKTADNKAAYPVSILNVTTAKRKFVPLLLVGPYVYDFAGDVITTLSTYGSENTIKQINWRYSSVALYYQNYRWLVKKDFLKVESTVLMSLPNFVNYAIDRIGNTALTAKAICVHHRNVNVNWRVVEQNLKVLFSTKGIHELPKYSYVTDGNMSLPITVVTATRMDNDKSLFVIFSEKMYEIVKANGKVSVNDVPVDSLHMYTDIKIILLSYNMQNLITRWTDLYAMPMKDAEKALEEAALWITKAKATSSIYYLFNRSNRIEVEIDDRVYTVGVIPYRRAGGMWRYLLCVNDYVLHPIGMLYPSWENNIEYLAKSHLQDSEINCKFNSFDLTYDLQQTLKRLNCKLLK